MTRTLRAVCLALVLGNVASAQSRADSAFAQLRPDGNGIESLRTLIKSSFDGPSAGEALSAIAQLARLNITFDPSLAGLATRMEIAPHERSAAVALLEVGFAARLRVRVSPDGNLVVDVADLRTQRAVAIALNKAVTLPAIRANAERDVRRDFNTQLNLGGALISNSELRASPRFLEPDLLRSIQALPGIEARSDYAAGFNARGGEADQNLILIDGYPIYSPFHLGGVFSTFIDPTVGRASLFTGGLPLRYGGRLSSVLDVRSAEPVSKEPRVTVEASVVSTTVSLGRRFGDDGTWMLAARRTYMDQVVNLFERDGFPYHFGDAQGHIAGDVGHGMRLSVTGYVGNDAAIGSLGNFLSGTWGNQVLGATLAKTIDGPSLLGDSLAWSQRVSFTGFNARVGASGLDLDVSNRVRDWRASGSATSFRGQSTRTIGYEVAAQSLRYAGKAVRPQLTDFYPLELVSQRTVSTSAFLEQSWRPLPALLVEGGVRVDALSQRAWMGVSPRLTVKYFWRPNTAFSLGTGRYAQWIHSLGHEETLLQPIQFWIASDKSQPVSRSHDVVAGFEHWLSPSRLLHVSAFNKRYDHVLIANSQSAPDVPGDEFLASSGWSRGVDVLLRQLDGGDFSGWLAYSYSQSERSEGNGRHYPATQDRRHNLNLVGSWRRGAWRLGTRLNVATGAPHTELLGAFARGRYDPTTRQWIPEDHFVSEQYMLGPRNSERLPWYMRLDASASREINIGRTQLAPYFSILNVFNFKNPAGYLYSFDRVPQRVSFPNLPFIPTFGVSFAF